MICFLHTNTQFPQISKITTEELEDQFKEDAEKIGGHLYYNKGL